MAKLCPKQLKFTLPQVDQICAVVRVCLRHQKANSSIQSLFGPEYAAFSKNYIKGHTGILSPIKDCKHHHQSFYIAGGGYNNIKPTHNATKSCLELHFMKKHHVTKGFHRDSDGVRSVYAPLNVWPPKHTFGHIRKPLQERKVQTRPRWMTPSQIKDDFIIFKRSLRNVWDKFLCCGIISVLMFLEKDKLPLKTTKVTIIVQKYSGRKSTQSVFTYGRVLCWHQQQYNCRCSLEGRWLQNLSVTLKVHLEPERIYQRSHLQGPTCL